MLVIRKAALENGAHDNLWGDEVICPPGWVVIPAELEEEAMDYLPFIVLSYDDEGNVTGVAQGLVPPPPTPPPTMEEQLAALQTALDDTDAMNVDQEYRLTLLELGIEE